MTRLEAFSIEGLSGRRTTIEIDLDPYVNVFWGLNGSGKTSLLRILDAALENNVAFLHRVAFTGASVTFFSNRQNKRFVRKVAFRSDEDQLRVMETDEGDFVRLIEPSRRFRWVTTPSMPGPPARRRMAHRYLPTSRLDLFPEMARKRTYGAALHEERHESTYDEAFAALIDDLWIRLTNDTLSAQRLVQQRGIAEIMSLSVTGVGTESNERLASDLSATDGYEIFTEFFSAQDMPVKVNRKNFIKRYQEDPVQRQIIAAIVRLNEDMAAAGESLEQLFVLIQRMFSGNKHLEQRSGHLTFLGDDGEPIPLRSLSSGEKQLVYILLETISAGPNVVLIDEPELSLHVDWQQALISAIRTVNPNVQLLIATHSPEIMADVADRNIFEL